MKYGRSVSSLAGVLGFLVLCVFGCGPGSVSRSEVVILGDRELIGVREVLKELRDADESSGVSYSRWKSLRAKIQTVEVWLLEYEGFALTSREAEVRRSADRIPFLRHLLRICSEVAEVEALRLLRKDSGDYASSSHHLRSAYRGLIAEWNRAVEKPKL